MNYTEKYIEKGFLEPELHWFKDNEVLQTIIGSKAYGTNNENSDTDIVSIVMPKYEHINPIKFGYILGFDEIPKWEHSESKGDKKVQFDSMDIEIEWISLIKFFHSVAVKGSPNLCEALFTRRNFVTNASPVGWMLKDNRKLFLSVRLYHSFKGYAISQLNRVKRGYVSGKTDNPKRQYLMDNYKYDLKMFSHVIRLLNQIKQILTEQDIDLMYNHEEVKAIKYGQLYYPFEEAEKLVLKRMEELETLSLKTGLSLQPQVQPLHQLLANCIEEFYGSESKMSKQGTEYVSVKMMMDRLDNMEKVLNKVEERTRPPEPLSDHLKYNTDF